jgi:uncharacterized membrane protein
VSAAVGLFAGLHSLLASRMVKQRAAARFGPRQFAGLYRVFYILQSALTLAGLLAYLSRLPDRTLYRVRGPLQVVWLLRLGQVGGLVFATAAASQVGLARITGLQGLSDWLRGRADIPPTPEAQGPAPVVGDDPTRLQVSGPFRVTRHPLNLSPLPVFWLTPHMTVKRLAFNLAGTLYLVLGSLHEEVRLRAAYGKAYRRYQKNEGVPFFLPE